MAEDFVIETEGLMRAYGTHEAVRGLDLSVPRGAVFGFLGLNGAGKSTTIRMLMGLIRRTGGTARVLGLDPARDEVEIKRRTGYVADSPIFYDWMSVAEICNFAAHYRRERWDAKRAEQLLARFRVPTDQKLINQSKGQRVKTALVMAMAFGPELLILDEPTSGLDPVARREFVEGVLAEFQQEGTTIFISSHMINELAGLMDYVGVLHEGRLLWSGPVEDFTASVHRVRLTFAGDAPRDLPCSGVLRMQRLGREAVLSMQGAPNEARLRAELSGLPIDQIRFEALNLEDAFVEFIGGVEREYQV